MKNKIISLMVATLLLTSCSNLMDYYVIDQPVGTSEPNFGEGEISQVIPGDYGMALMGCNFAFKDYEFCKNKQKEGVVYEYIKSVIVAQTDINHNENNLNQLLFQRLNNTNIGITCTVQQCDYHGYQIWTMNNIKSESSRLSKTGRTDYYISFNPNQFEQTYQAWMEHSDDKEVPFKRTLLTKK